MIDLYSWPTPNGHKVHIMLEEVGLPYQVHGIDILKGEQFSDDFLKISPNNKIPAIIDHDGINGKPVSLFESGAILIYLAEKTGKLLPSEKNHQYYTTIQWLMFQMGGVGPMLGQAHHFNIYADEKIPYAINRYVKEANRLHMVMDKELSKHQWIAGQEYSIADIAIYPWIRYPERKGVNLGDYPHLERWFNACEAREAVKRGCEVLENHRKSSDLTDSEKNAMFGDQQFQKR